MKLLKKIIVFFNITRVPSILFYLFRIFPIKNNRIVFVNFTGRGYGDNPKYIAEKLLNDKYDLVWLVNDTKDKTIPNQIKKIKIFSAKACYYLTTARVWVNNSRFEQCVVKRKGQYYIQTWHGGIGIKKVEYDVLETLSPYYKKVMKNDNKMIDLIPSNCEFLTNRVYREAFRYNGEIMKCGIPREDILAKDKAIITNKVKERYKVPNDNKIILYAPTFRADYSHNPYDIDFEELKKIIEKKYDENYSILIRLHPRISSRTNELIQNAEKYIDTSDYSDMQELVCACDILITDYSSTMSDAMLAGKAVILYANDRDYYETDRGCIFDYNELPFPKAKNNDELKSIFSNSNIEELKECYKTFLSKDLKIYEMGNASDKIVERINHIIGGNEKK